MARKTAALIIGLGFAFCSGIGTHAYANEGEKKDIETEEALRKTMAISDIIDSSLARLEPYRNAIIWSQGFLEIIANYPFVDFRLLEGRLRKMGSGTYLIAAPVSTAPEGTCAHALYYPQDELEYYLWVGVNGKEEAEAQMQTYGIESYEKNLENLQRTGFLVKKGN